MTESSLPLSSTSPSNGLAYVKSALALFPGKSDAHKLQHFKSKFILALVSCTAFGLGALFSAPQWMMLPLVLAQVILLSVPYLYLTVRQLQRHLAKLPAILAAHLSFTQIMHSENFAIVASGTLLVLSYVFYADEKRFQKAKTDSDHLQNLTPAQARLSLNETQTQMVARSAVKAGDVLLVYSGEIVPRDGKIISGTTSVDESRLTQESKPCHKTKGDFVVGGALNRDSDILVEVQNAPGNDILDLLITKTKSTLGENFPLKKRVEFVSRFLPVFFILLALAVGLYLALWQSASWLQILTLTSGILLASAFGADALSQVALLSLVGQIFKQGIVLGHAKTIEKLSHIHTIFFNKTGLLTQGEFTHSQDVVQIGNSLGDVLSILFSLEDGLDHPLARAIETHAWFNEIETWKVSDKKLFAGLGISGKLSTPDGHSVMAYVGNLRFMKRNQCLVSKELKSKIDELEALGETVILCGFEGQVRGLSSFCDNLRRNVRPTLSQIHKLGIKMALITGDAETAVTQALGTRYIDEIYARLTPEEKLTQLQKVKKPWGTVALVSNDTQSQSFENAKVTISIDCGVDVRDHPADVMIMGSNLKNLGWLLAKTRDYRRAVRTGLWGSTFVAALSLALLFLGLANPITILAVSSLWALVTLRLSDI